MKTTILTCDRCDRGYDDDIIVKSYRLNDGEEMDPSGNGYNIHWKFVDFCDYCYIIASKTYGDKIHRL